MTADDSVPKIRILVFDENIERRSSLLKAIEDFEAKERKGIEAIVVFDDLETILFDVSLQKLSENLLSAQIALIFADAFNFAGEHPGLFATPMDVLPLLKTCRSEGNLLDTVLVVVNEFGFDRSIQEGLTNQVVERADYLGARSILEVSDDTTANYFVVEKISELISEAPSVEEIPEQIRHALVFGGQGESPFHLIDPPGEGLLESIDQRQSHEDIRDKTEALIAECGVSNRLAGVRRCAEKLLRSMGRTLNELQVRAFWAQMNSLRRRAEADERCRQTVDPESPPLPETVAAALLDLVDTLNVFAAYEPKLSELDEVAQDPSERITTADNLAAAFRISEAAATDRKILTREAAETLQETVQDANGNGPSAERAKQFGVRSVRNFSIEAIRRVYRNLRAEPGFAWREMRAGVYRQLGPSTVATLGPFVLQFEADIRRIISTLGSGATLQRILDIIVHALRSAGL